MASEMKIEYINPFLVAATSVLSNVCGVKLSAGKPYVKTTSFDESSVVISLGVTGQVSGQVLIAVQQDVACDIASKMCMMPITQLDDLSMSALSELGNMMLGNAATLLSTKGILIDITPPLAVYGSDLQLKSDIDGLKVPLLNNGEEYIALYICVYQE